MHMLCCFISPWRICEHLPIIAAKTHVQLQSDVIRLTQNNKMTTILIAAVQHKESIGRMLSEHLASMPEATGPVLNSML